MVMGEWTKWWECLGANLTILSFLSGFVEHGDGAIFILHRGWLRGSALPLLCSSNPISGTELTTQFPFLNAVKRNWSACPGDNWKSEVEVVK